MPNGAEDDDTIQDKVQCILENGQRLAKEGKAEGRFLVGVYDEFSVQLDAAECSLPEYRSLSGEIDLPYIETAGREF